MGDVYLPRRARCLPGRYCGTVQKKDIVKQSLVLETNRSYGSSYMSPITLYNNTLDHPPIQLHGFPGLHLPSLSCVYHS